MPFILLITVLFVIFGVLIFLLRYILTRNITKATGHLEEMSQEYITKQAEITRRLQESKQESQETIAQAKREAEESRNKILQEANAFKEQTITEARRKSEEMVEQAQKTCETLKQEIQSRIEKGSLQKACELLQKALPDEFRSQLHTLWMDEAEKTEFDLGRLNLPEHVQEIKMASAFPLTERQKQILDEKLTKRLGNHIQITNEVDPRLVVGFVITIGNVVIDGSLSDKIQKQFMKG